MNKKLGLALVSIALVSGLVVGGMKATSSKAEVTPPQPPAQPSAIIEGTKPATNTQEPKPVDETQSNFTASPAPVTNHDKIEPIDTPPAAPVTADAPPATVSYYVVTEDGPNVTCTLSYTDGSKHTFVHRQTSGDVTAVMGVCDDSLLGKTKQNNYLGY